MSLEFEVLSDFLAICLQFSAKSLVNKTGIVSSVAKSDEIGKIAHLVWCEILRELLNQAFVEAAILHQNLKILNISHFLLKIYSFLQQISIFQLDSQVGIASGPVFGPNSCMYVCFGLDLDLISLTRLFALVALLARSACNARTSGVNWTF